ncbi:MFS transporter [Microbulbifer sp. TRSA007]|uniref:MFS transporter n=1 Tax=Microbulbifer sp. TRSA007 TaxID=3243384 RepID=UPI0040391C5C
MVDKKPSVKSNLYLGLGALSLAIFLVANDFTAFSPALPVVEQEFQSDLTTSQWVISAYALVCGVLIVSGGRLADMYGRRRTFIVGLLIFMFFSFLGGIAGSMGMLLVSRAFMGAGSALIWPSVLGMMYSLMTPKNAGLAGGLIITICGIANSVGPLVGGFLADYISWRWILFINLPLSLVVLYLCFRVIPPDSLNVPKDKLDYRGVALLSSALFSLLLAFDFVVDVGFKNYLVFGLFMAFFLLFCLFILVEGRAAEGALIPPDVAGNKSFVTAACVALLIAQFFYAGFFFIPQYLSKVHGASATIAGLGLVPLMLAFSVFGFVAGNVYKVLGAKLIVSIATLLMALGLYMLSHIYQDGQYIRLVPGLLILGAGIGLFNSTIITFAISVVDPRRASLAGAIIFMIQIAGGAVGLGLNTTIVAMAGDISYGISQAFTLNAYLAMLSFIICVLFIGSKEEKA